jgi:hypothetical protein
MVPLMSVRLTWRSIWWDRLAILTRHSRRFTVAYLLAALPEAMKAAAT